MQPEGTFEHQESLGEISGSRGGEYEDIYTQL
jgi:hypothetical protein